MSAPASLRRRIAFAVPGIASAVVLVAAVALWFAARAVLLQQVDGDLRAHLERWQRIDASGVAPRLRRQLRAASRERPDPRRFLQLVDAQTGRDLERSPTLPDEIDLAALARWREAPGTPRFAALPDGRRVRAVAGPVTHVADDGATTPAYVVLGVDTESIDGSLRVMAVTLATLWGAASLMAWGAGVALRSAILRPLDDLAGRIAALAPDAAEDRSARLPADVGPLELRGVVERLNGLLDRVGEAFEREQATIASIAHELRTPVAALRARIEFRLLAEVGDGEAATLTECLATVTRMQAMVANLLLLARLEAGREPLTRERVDVGALVDDVAAACDDAARARGQELRVERPATPACAQTSAAHLRLILDNLVGNAVAHGARGAIVAAVTPSDGGIRVRITNALRAPLDATELGRAFWRADAARAADGHSGLGLALCRRLARLLGVRLDFRVDDGRLLVEALVPTVPVAQPPTPAHAADRSPR